MKSLQKFNQFVKDNCDFISDMNLYNDIIKDLELLDSIKEVFKKVIYTPYNEDGRYHYANTPGPVKTAGSILDNITNTHTTDPNVKHELKGTLAGRNKCEGCPTYERIKRGEMFVSDECSFCQNSPTKVTCYSSNSTMDYCGCGNTIGDIHSVGSCEGSCSCGNKKGGKKC